MNFDNFHDMLVQDSCELMDSYDTSVFDVPYDHHCREFIPIMTCIYNFSNKCLDKMIKLNCDLNIQNSCGSAPLHVACYSRNYDAVKLLVDNGADLNIRDKWGKTPIFQAAHHNDFKIVEYLFSRCDTTLADNRGQTILTFQNVGEDMRKHIQKLSGNDGEC